MLGKVIERKGKEMRWRAGKEYRKRGRRKREGGGYWKWSRMWREGAYRIERELGGKERIDAVWEEKWQIGREGGGDKGYCERETVRDKWGNGSWECEIRISWKKTKKDKGGWDLA
jgi:hypothetical protein